MTRHLMTDLDNNPLTRLSRRAYVASVPRVRNLCDQRRRFRTASRSTLKLCDPTAKLNSLLRPLVGELQRAALGPLQTVNLGAQPMDFLHAGQQHVVRYRRRFCRHDTEASVH